MCGAWLGATPEAELEEISVIASRMPTQDVRADVVAESLLEGFHDVSEILNQLPSIAVSRAGGLGSLTQLRVRGAEANHTKVLLDGVSVNELDAGFNYGSMSAGGIKRVEVLHGPLSSIWGSDALAGVIAFDTRPTESQTQLSMGYGSHASLNRMVSFDRVFANSFISLHVADRQSDG